MHCWSRYIFIVVVAALGILSMIEACGRKGPLYLPDESDRQSKTAPASGADVPKPQAAPAKTEPAR